MVVLNGVLVRLTNSTGRKGSSRRVCLLVRNCSVPTSAARAPATHKPRVRERTVRAASPAAGASCALPATGPETVEMSEAATGRA
eukprot:6110598-Pleurochrysis_carterae.AAC.1